MVERLKNKKGFTIIEVMVVIALIGILAAVLVPQFGGVKDRAKDAGVLTNAKMVEAYVASAIDSYETGTALESAIEAHFAAGTLRNPYKNSTAIDDTISVDVNDAGGYSSSGTAGVIYVVIDGDDDKLTTKICGFDSKGNIIEASKRELSK